MNEFELIDLLARRLPTNKSVVVGAGDDCAVLEMGNPGNYLLFKTDAVVEGVHFTRDTAPERIGHKALGRCLSDIAAMAGIPTCALVTLGLPPSFDVKFIEAIYEGMHAIARRHGVAIAGGETTTSPERIFLSISMLGMAPVNRCVLRSGAKAGDALFVTGELGGSLSGKHLDFEPRVTEAQWLAGRFAVHSMIDLSDGLAGDLRHILTASKVGAELLTSAIPVSRAARLRSKTRPPIGAAAKTPLAAALTDGEDFELLFTVSSKTAVALLDAWKKRFPQLRLTCIGKITPEPGLRLRDRTGVQSLTDHGYVHFQES